MSRNGYLGVWYKDQILIFGGEKGKLVFPAQRDITNDLLVYDVKT